MPRWLDSLSKTRDGDMTGHAVVMALGAPALELCMESKLQYNHHCLLDPHWPGPNVQYHFGSDW